MIFTQEQKDLLIGTLLGDAHMSTKTKGRTWYYVVKHSLKQKDYLFHKHALLKSICLSEPKYFEQTNGRLPKLHPGYRFNTSVHESLRFYGTMFYKLNPETDRMVRGVPTNIAKFLTPRAIAYWYMDDGYLKWSGKSNAMVLSTDSFHLHEINCLRAALSNLYGIETQLNRKNPKHEFYGYRISINEKNSLLFRALIKDHVLESMLYKLKLKDTHEKKII